MKYKQTETNFRKHLFGISTIFEKNFRNNTIITYLIDRVMSGQDEVYAWDYGTKYVCRFSSKNLPVGFWEKVYEISVKFFS